jgi:hydrogenase nickel incorporation protein HypA/HybF
MHEYSIIDALMRQIDSEAKRIHATKVHRVELRIGDLAGVERDLLAFAFEAYRENTICDGAELAIHPVAARWECRNCDAPQPAGGALRCASCQQPLTLAEGDEIILERMEMEVPDVPGLRMR